MNEVSIEIQLANRKYPLRINETDANAVIRAAELVNSKLQEFEEKYQIRDIQDLYAMSALQLAVQYTDKQEPHPLVPEQVANQIAHLNGLLEASLSEK
jgi:cell division protein ZapA (FtsZ GTPase activity inhibitor)